MCTFTVFIGFVPPLPIPQVLALPVFLPHYALFLTQGKAVGDHGDEFAVGGLAPQVVDGIAKVAVEGIAAHPISCP